MSASRHFLLLCIIFVIFKLLWPLRSRAAEVWASRYDRPISGPDAGTALATDASGNLYAGILAGTFQPSFVTLKLSPEGKRLWAAGHDLGRGGNNWYGVSAIHVDSAGRATIAGEDFIGPRDSAFAVLQYDAGGRELWIAQVDGAPGYPDQPEALATDGDGNIYVAGRSWNERVHFRPSDEEGFDILTAKLDRSGQVLWTARYDGPGQKKDVPAGLAVDATGNAYLAGTSVAADGWYEYVTLKYSSDGELLWEARHRGAVEWMDTATGLALDNRGGIYVTGISAGGITTLKYDAAGALLWTARREDPNLHEGLPVGPKLDGGGNLYLASTVETAGSGEKGALVIKYSSAGDELWAAPSFPAGIQDTHIWDLAVRENGEAAIAGDTCSRCNQANPSRGYWTIKLDAEGKLSWQAFYDQPGMDLDRALAVAFDPSGNVCVTGISEGDAATVKYDAGGKELWADRYDRLDIGHNYAAAMALDPFGNACIAGFSIRQTGFTTLKFDDQGSRVWEVFFETGYSGVQAALATDRLGNIYVTGEGAKPAGLLYGSIGKAVKYSKEGKEQWVANLEVEGAYSFNPFLIKTDEATNAFIAGTTYESMVTMKLDPFGRKAWAQVHDRGDQAGESPTDLLVDRSGNVYMCGISGAEYVILRYGNDGSRIWERRVAGGPQFYYSEPSLAVDGAANLYFAATKKDALWYYSVAKYSPNGLELWVKNYGDPKLINNAVRAAAADSVGNVYVTGSVYIEGSGYDYVTIKLDRDGNFLWSAQYDSGMGPNDHAFFLALDDSGNIYVTGRSEGAGLVAGSGYDIATVKYAPDGREIWAQRYDGPGSGEDYPVALALDRSGGVYIGGTSTGEGTGADFVVLKYESAAAPEFIRGDCDGDGQVAGAVTDSIFLLLYNFSGGIRPPCLAACDADGDGQVEGQVTDAVYLLQYNFLGGPPPAPPFPKCGRSGRPADEALGCGSPPSRCE